MLDGTWRIPLLPRALRLTSVVCEVVCRWKLGWALQPEELLFHMASVELQSQLASVYRCVSACSSCSRYLACCVCGCDGLGLDRDRLHQLQWCRADVYCSVIHSFLHLCVGSCVLLYMLLLSNTHRLMKHDWSVRPTLSHNKPLV